MLEALPRDIERLFRLGHHRLAPELPGDSDQNKIAELLDQRESEASTAISGFTAIPHIGGVASSTFTPIIPPTST